MAAIQQWEEITMKYFFILIICCVINLFAESPDCGTTSSKSVVLQNGNQALVYILVDFKDGRKQVGRNHIEPQTQSDLSGLNINSVGSIGWEKVNADSPFTKKIRKYVYDNYWDMIFADTTYLGSSIHPDYSSHNSTLDSIDGTNYDLRVWGSIRDYWAEVSYNKWLIYPYATHGAGVGKYQTGIINNIDSTSVAGKKFVKWIMMDSIKSYYGNNEVKIITAVKAKLDSLYQKGEIDFNRHSYSGKIGILYAGGHEGFGGMAEDIDSTMFYHSEKVTGYDNSNFRSVFCGIANHAHEYGHAIGIRHQAAGPYDIMHVGGLGKRINQFSPPHINPLLKFQRRWLTMNDTVRITSSRSFSLPPITHSQPKVGILTIYGDGGRDSNWEHSEYYLLEYRKREKFNRFTGGVNANFGSDEGGILIWHQSAYSAYRADSLIGAGVSEKFSIVEPFYGQGFQCNNGTDASTTHFYYSGRDSIGMTTFPSTNSNSNLVSGIKLSNISVSNNQMNVTATYSLGSVPSWTKFIYDFYAYPDTLLSGKVFYAIKEGAGNPYTIVQGTEVHFAPGAALNVDRLIAISSSQDSIVLRGAGFGIYRSRWKGVILRSVPGGSSMPSIVKKCKISDAERGLTIERALFRDSIYSNSFSNNLIDVYLNNEDGIQLMPILSGNTYGSLKISGSWSFASSQNLTIESGRNLILDEGASMQMGTSSNIISYGKIKSNGTPSNPVRFFSLTNAANSWGNIVFDGNGADYSDLSNFKLERGGEIQCLNGADVIIDSVIFRKMNRAVYFNNSAPWILNCNIDSVTLSAIEGVANYQDVSLYGDSIKRGYTTNAYKGIYYNATNGNIINNKIQGFSQGMYFKSSSNPLFNKGDGSNPNPNNKIKWNGTGIHVRDESYPDIGDLDAVEGNNMIDSNTTYNIVAELGSYVMAENNYFGCGSTHNIYDGDSYISTEAILITNPFSGASCTSSSTQLEEAMSVAPMLSESARALKKQFKLGLKLKGERKPAQAFDHFKAMYLQNNLSRAALSQITTLYNDTIDFGVYDFLNEQKLITNDHQKTVLLHLARLNYRRGDIPLTKQQLSKVISDHPNTEESKNAEFERFYLTLHNEKNKDLATQYFSELEGKYTEEEIAGPRYLLQTARFDVPESETNGTVQLRIPMQKQCSVNGIKTPLQFELSSNYPNPFNPTTTISYSIPEPSLVILTVYDNLGRTVTDMENSFKPEGKYEVVFDASKVSSGVYYYKIVAGKNSAVRRMLLLK